MLVNGLPKDAPLVFSAYLPTRMDRSFYRAMQEPQFLTCFDPRIAGWLLKIRAAQLRFIVEV